MNKADIERVVVTTDEGDLNEQYDKTNGES